jgi:lysyl-tRNA synthetase class 1
MTAVGGDWVSDLADRVLAERTTTEGRIVCASGISPSGPIHLGNLREIMVPHLVADELRRRGLEAVHVLSWDDYDRLRKVPADVPESFAEHIGRPLTSVPDPCGEHESWSEHFKAPFRAALVALGVEVVEVNQTEQYRSGAYRDQILLAMARRDVIGDTLARYRTAKADAGEPSEDDDDEDDASTSQTAIRYSPYKPYCQTCGRDTTTVTSYDDSTTELSYTCSFGHGGAFALAEVSHGKLVWKVDWPMRWAYEGVDFESGGNDHSSPNSSFTVGSDLVREVFGGHPPSYVPYSFVGTKGAAKMSSSAGGAPTPSDALDIMEPSILRWLYNRRKPNQSITVAFDDQVSQLYDEWDALARRLDAGTADAREVAVHTRAVSTASATLPETPRPVAYRTLASVVDITNGDDTQVLRIVNAMVDEPVADIALLRPRLDRATTWITKYVPVETRTQVRAEPDADRLAALTDFERAGLDLLLAGLDQDWTLAGLTTLLYGVPKQQRGLPPDAERTKELQAAQREFFVLLYTLLVGRDTGPRLPTLVLALGADRVRSLLTPP